MEDKDNLEAYLKPQESTSSMKKMSPKEIPRLGIDTSFRRIN